MNWWLNHFRECQANKAPSCCRGALCICWSTPSTLKPYCNSVLTFTLYCRMLKVSPRWDVELYHIFSECVQIPQVHCGLLNSHLILKLFPLSFLVSLCLPKLLSIAAGLHDIEQLPLTGFEKCPRRKVCLHRVILVRSNEDRQASVILQGTTKQVN